MTKPKIEIYTDGAARGNPGPGGYGIVLMSGKHRKELSEGFRKTTNNRMELLAVIVALETLKIKNSDVTVYTDSKYVSESVNQDWISGWIKKSFKKVKNPDLWKRLINIYKLHNVKFIWVKG
ncbi:MAG: ribonuclease HI, partial [Bacteroidales bacterium]|nr:ribonuclease HI [Bacteroidales bacterium]